MPKGNIVRRAEDINTSKDKTARNLRKFQWNCCRVLCLNLRLRCPQFCSKVCCCLRLDKKRRILNKNYRNLEKEIHISYILKQLRVVKNLVKEGLTQDQWKRAFAKYSLISYMTSEDDG